MYIYIDNTVTLKKKKMTVSNRSYFGPGCGSNSKNWYLVDRTVIILGITLWQKIINEIYHGRP